MIAGVIAVPVYPLRNKRQSKRLLEILASCQPSVILGDETTISHLQSALPKLSVPCIDVNQQKISSSLAGIEFESGQENDIIFLQYTSGSTGTPKGVMVSSKNLQHNLRTCQQGWGLGENKTIVSWLPFQHDLGLIGAVLSSLYNRNDLYFFSPVTVIRQPYRWLQAISTTKAYFTAGPNFSYQLCVDKISEAECCQLDLSRLGYALAAAEPNRLATMRAFCDKFKQCGFNESAYAVGYGLAESTLHVATNTPGSVSPTMHLSSEALEAGQIQEVNASSSYHLLAAGTLHPEHEIVIVDATTQLRVMEHHIGEIWVHSDSVAMGYWALKSESEETFAAKIRNEPEKTYMRTGDLGFVKDGQLYITGRLKDLIIVDGRNIYPHDIEEVVEACHDYMMPGSAAAFSIEEKGKESLVVALEIRRTALKKDLTGIKARIRQRVAEEFDVYLQHIIFLVPGGAHKTTSGKIQRKATKSAFLSKSLNCLMNQEDASQPLTQKPEHNEKHHHVDNKALLHQIQTLFCKVLDCKSVDSNQRFTELGGTSLHATLLYEALQEQFANQMSFDITVAYDYPSVQQLYDHISAHLAKTKIEQTPKQMTPMEAENIAIVGLSFRLPGGAKDLYEFWQQMVEAKQVVVDIPQWRWSLDGFSMKAQATLKKAACIDNVELFDASFFNISPKEAIAMDSQQRLLLEVTWHALENASINPLTLNQTDTSVTVGCSSNDYRNLESGQDDNDITPYFVLNTASSVLAGRISYFYGLQGASQAIDTACSSGLVSIAEACNKLHENTSAIALACSINLLVDPYNSFGLYRANMLSSTNQCHTFSSEANGYVRAEGCGVLVLKTEQQAKIDKDRVYALIVGKCVNHDGQSSGLTVPNRHAQRALIETALNSAKLDIADIDYIEAHGSATELGDPIEIAAINDVLDQSSKQHQLMVSSVKANLGHLEGAAGMAGVIKVIACLQQKSLPATQGLRHLNDKLPIKLPIANLCT